jgi:hypothetical protein
MIADQIAADYERVGELKKKLGLEYVELNPGRYSYVKHAKGFKK